MVKTGKRERGKKLFAHIFYESCCLCFYTSVCSLLSAEWVRGGYLQPLLSLPYSLWQNPDWALITSLPVLPSACTLPSRVSIVSLSMFPPSSPMLYLDQPFPNLFASSLFSPFPCSLNLERERHIRRKIKSAGCCVSTWIPTHLVIAVSEPADNSLNCLPSNLWWDWGGDGKEKKKKKSKERWQKE